MEKLILNGMQQIAYRKIDGDPHRPYLVFLHEGLGAMEMWKEFPQALCRRLNWPGLLYDRQGYGHSSPLSRRRGIHYMHEYALRELPEVLQQLLPADHPFFLIGHSDGGSIALIFASEQNSNLMGIITEAAHIFVEPATLQGIERAVKNVDKGILDGLRKYHGEKTDEMFYAWSDTWLAPHFSHWNIEYLLPSIQCPVMVIQGVDDQYGTVAQVDGIVNLSGGDAIQCVMAKCGHTPHHERADMVTDGMAEFLLKVFSGSPSPIS